MVSEIGKSGPIDPKALKAVVPVLSKEEGNWITAALASIKQQKPIEVLRSLCRHEKEDGLSIERVLFLVEALRTKLSREESMLIDDELIASLDSPEFASLLGEIQTHPEQHRELSLALACKEIREKKISSFNAIEKYRFSPESIDGQKAIIEIAKIAAAQDSWETSYVQMGAETSYYIQNYGIKDEKALIEIAKIAAAQNGLETSTYIKNYGITDKQALIEIAKIAAAQNGEGTSYYIQNYGISDETALIEIAKIAAAKHGGGTSRQIQKYGIQDKKALVEIAKIAAAQHGWGTSEHIQKYDIQDEKALIEIAKIAVTQSGLGTSEHIQKYDIKDENARVKIAKIAAAQDGYGVSWYIKNYGITDKQTHIEIAKIAAAQSGYGASRYIKNYDITDKQALIEIAKIAAAQDGDRTSECIKNYDITDKQALAEIAKIAAAKSGEGTSEHIQKYGIQDENALIEIAKIAASENVIWTIHLIENYEIKNPKLREEIARFLITKATVKIASLASMDRKKAFQNIDSLLTRDDKKGSSFLNSAMAFLDLGKTLGQKDVTAVYQDVIGLCISTFNLKQRDLMWLDEALLRAKEPFMKERLLDWFIKTAAISALHPELFGIMSSIKLLEVISRRDPLLRASLTQELVEASFSKKLIGLTNSLGDEPKEIPLRIPLLICTNYPEDCQDASRKFITGLNQSKFRVAYKDGKKQTLLIETLLAIKNSSLNNLEKSALLTSLSKMDVEVQLKALRLVSDILAFKGDDKLKGELTLQDLQDLLSTVFTDKFDIKVENFQDKYDQTIGTWRRKEALITYAGKLNLLGGREKTEALKCLKEVVKTVLEGSFEKSRNSSQNNPHLAEIEKRSPEVFKKWQETVSLEPSEMELDRTLSEKSLLKPVKNQIQMAIEQHHLGGDIDTTRLKLGLQDPSTQLAIVDEELKALSDQVDKNQLLIEKGIYELLLLGEDKESLKNKLNELNSQVAPASVFKTDIAACLTFLEEKKSGGSLEVLESTDPNDFLLMGTEVEGSCQKVDGAPTLNKCLLGYCLDGKHRLFLIKQEGKIVARSVARLLIDEKGSPVLFQERNYFAENNPTFAPLLRKLAIKKAKVMGVPLAVSKTDFEKEMLVAYPTPLNAKAKPVPFEYVDAAGGIQTGPYKIKDVMQVNLPDG